MSLSESYNQLFFGVVCAAGLLALAILKLSFVFKSRNKHPNEQLAKLVDTLTPYSRRLIFSGAVIWSVLLYVKAAYGFDQTDAALSFLARGYGLSALGGVFTVLSIGLMAALFPNATINKFLFRASRGVGLSTFYLATLHAACAFTSNLDGNIGAAAFLSPKHQLALLCSSLAFIILLAMAATSVDKIIAIMTFRRWKKLHRFVHLAAILVVVHAFLIGSHFLEANRAIPLVVMTVSLTILLLEAAAIHIKLTANQKKLAPRAYGLSHLGLITILLFGMGISYYGLYAFSDPPNPHAGHTAYLQNYELSITHTPNNFLPGEATQLYVTITDTNTNQRQTQFYESYDKILHLIVISDDMKEFYHLHPEHDGNGGFTVAFTPENGGRYYAYADFSPQQGAEALAMAEITSDYPAKQASQPIEVSSRLAEKDGYQIELHAPDQIKASEVTPVTFDIKDSSGSPVTSLETYLGQYGHLAVIHEDKRSYVHVHPTPATTKQEQGQLGFEATLPRPGKYKMYLQFQDKGRLQVVQYVVEVI